MAGGGTGGHLYPGLAIAEAVLRARPEAAFAFATTLNPIDAALLADTGYPVTPLPARPFRLKPWTWPGFLVALGRCGYRIRRRFLEFGPEVVVGLGGYGSYVPVRVAQDEGLATVVLNPDIVPGRANRRAGREADVVCCQFRETLEYFPSDRVRRTGCPIRPSLLLPTRDEAVAVLGLDPERRTLLVTGASSGARTVNRAVLGVLRQRGLPDGWQVLHLAGRLDYESVAAAYQDIGVHGAVKAYEPRMGLAYAAADLAVARAGASTIAELLAAGVPTVYLPYPFHRDQHQMHQARAVERNGAALVIEDRREAPRTTARELGDALEGLMPDKVWRVRMRECALEAARPKAAEEVAAAVLDLADAAAARRRRVARRDVDKTPATPYTPTGEPSP